jgi:hypothetical protein
MHALRYVMLALVEVSKRWPVVVYTFLGDSSIGKIGKREPWQMCLSRPRRRQWSLRGPPKEVVVCPLVPLRPSITNERQSILEIKEDTHQKIHEIPVHGATFDTLNTSVFCHLAEFYDVLVQEWEPYHELSEPRDIAYEIKSESGWAHSRTCHNPW